MNPISQWLPNNINDIQISVVELLMVTGYLVKEEISAVNLAMLFDLIGKIKGIEE